jgi:micrococcal nuclease
MIVAKRLLLACVCVMFSACTEQATITVERAPTSLSATPNPDQDAQQARGPGPVDANGAVHTIVDGDTVKVLFDGSKAGADETVRLIGIDTPETKRPNTPIQCFGLEATRFITALLPPGTRVRVERDVEQRDHYGRLLGYVFRAEDGLFVNDALARFGYAQQSTYPPNVAYVDRFRDSVSSARDASRGLWGSCPLR